MAWIGARYGNRQMGKLGRDVWNSLRFMYKRAFGGDQGCS